MTPELLGGLLLGALAVYAISAGADFGGGVWDLFVRGPRAGDARRLIERAIAPVWEANHVWLVLVVIVLFTAFPPAFAALGVRLHAPVTAALVGIVLRGSALVFRQYGGAPRWGVVFAVASAVTPFFLGLVLGGATADGRWLSPFALATGALALALCAYLAAIYLVVEAGDRAPALSGDFRGRACASWLAVAVTAPLAAWTASADAPRFAARLFGSVGLPIILVAATAGVGALAATLRRRHRLARALAVAQVAAVVLGWGAAQYPYLVAPDITLRGAAAPAATLDVLGPILVIGAAVVLPPFVWLLRVFKRPPAHDS